MTSFQLLITAFFFGVLMSSRAVGQVEFAADDNIHEHLQGQENLIVIQTVSNTQKTFVIQRGRSNGITPLQKGLFSTDKVSLVARVLEASRYFSLWEVSDPNAIIPFQKGQFVVYNNSLDPIWTKIPELRETLKRRILVKKKRDRTSYWTVRGSFSTAVSESISETPTGITEKRNGFHTELVRMMPWQKRLDWGVGLRYDTETARIAEPELIIPTTRFYALLDITYSLSPPTDRADFWYTSLVIGLGRSSTTVDDAVSTGTSTILPGVRIGYKTHVGAGYSLLVEGQVEAVNQTEEFRDGTEQQTQLVNLKANIGLRF